jgi:hypothetical protein
MASIVRAPSKAASCCRCGGKADSSSDLAPRQRAVSDHRAPAVHDPASTGGGWRYVGRIQGLRNRAARLVKPKGS